MEEPLERRILSDPNLLKPEVACVIGHVIVHWSRLEDFITYFIQELLGLQHEPATVIYSETSSLQKANILRGLVSITRDVGLLDECDVLLAEYHRIRSIRNDIVHGIWSKNGDDYIVHRVASQGYPKIKPTSFNMLQLRELFTAIINCIELFNNYSGRLNARDAAGLIARKNENPFQAPRQSQAALSLDQARLEKKRKRELHNFRSAKKPRSSLGPNETTSPDQNKATELPEQNS